MIERACGFALIAFAFACGLAEFIDWLLEPFRKRA